MSGFMLFIIVFCAALISSVLSVVIWEARMKHDCHGSIIMYEDQVYLSLTKDDMDAFEHARYATLRLQREKFQGFNE